MSTPSTRRSGRVVLVALTVIAVHLSSASAAGAHADLRGSNPAAGSTIDVLPDSIELEFTDDMSEPATIEVLAPDGERIDAGEVVVEGKSVAQSVTDPGEAGLYLITYEATSADAHQVSGSFKFRVSSGTPTESDATSKPTKSDQEFAWFFVGFGVLAAIVAVLWIVGRLRRSEG